MRAIISIHALVKRATAVVIYLPDFISISIHALVKRATLTDFKVGLEVDDFNPRPREEGDGAARRGSYYS